MVDVDEDFAELDDDFEVVEDEFEEVETVAPEPPVKPAAKPKAKTPAKRTRKVQPAAKKTAAKPKATISSTRAAKAKPAPKVVATDGTRRGRKPVKVPKGHAKVATLANRLKANPALIRRLVREDLGIPTQRGHTVILDPEQIVTLTESVKAHRETTGGKPGRPKGYRMTSPGKLGAADVVAETGARLPIVYAAIQSCGIKAKPRGNGAVYEMTETQYARVVKKINGGKVKVERTPKAAPKAPVVPKDAQAAREAKAEAKRKRDAAAKRKARADKKAAAA